MPCLSRTLVGLAAVCAAAAAAPAVAGADDYFLKLEGIKGESAVAAHEDEIDVQSYAVGVSRGRSTTARPQFSEFNVTKQVDRASPLLLLRAAGGSAIPRATFYVRRPGEVPSDYLKYCFTDLHVVSVSQSGGSGGRPAESVAFDYATIVESYTRRAPDGSAAETVFGGWDLVRNLQYGPGDC